MAKLDIRLDRRQLVFKTAVCLAAAAGVGASAQVRFNDQQKRNDEGGVLRIDSRIDGLLATNSRVQMLLEDHNAWFEGPVWVDTPQGGHLLFSDVAGDSILQWSQHTKLARIAGGFFETTPASRSREFDLGTRKSVLKGPNGLAIDALGRIIFCGFGPRYVGRLNADGAITVLAQTYQGRRLNTPNDLVVSRQGIYFTDSSAEPTVVDARFPGVKSSAIYRIADGEIEMLDDDFVAANGLAFSPNEDFLYVNDTRRKLIWRYKVDSAGRLGQRTLFVDMRFDTAPGVPDGMKVDTRGNVYCTGPRGLWIMSADGMHLGIVATPERLTNIAFGERDRRTLYLTGPSYLWRLALKG